MAGICGLCVTITHCYYQWGDNDNEGVNHEPDNGGE
jgi:hypothetical protein